MGNHKRDAFKPNFPQGLSPGLDKLHDILTSLPDEKAYSDVLFMLSEVIVAQNRDPHKALAGLSYALWNHPVIKAKAALGMDPESAVAVVLHSVGTAGVAEVEAEKGDDVRH